MTLAPVTSGNKRAKRRCEFRSMLGFLVGLEGKGMPRDVFRDVLMDFLMPVWDPLRRKRGDVGERAAACLKEASTG